MKIMTKINLKLNLDIKIELRVSQRHSLYEMILNKMNIINNYFRNRAWHPKQINMNIGDITYL